MNRDTIRQIGVIIATGVMIMINALANIIPFNGVTTGEVSDMFKVYFVPAGYVFSIWGVIYLAVIAYSIYQALPGQKENPSLRKIGWWYIGGSLANACWIFLWHYQLFLFTLIMMTGLLVSLLVIYEKLNIGSENITTSMRFCVHLPFSIYLGWITVATIANIADVLYILGWGGFGMDPKIWAVILMVVAIVVAELMAYNRQDFAYLAVLMWGFIGIAVKNSDVSPVFEAACAAALFVLLIAIFTLIFKPKLKKRV